MIWLLIVLAVLFCFAGVILTGAPYLPTLSPQVEAALQLAALQPGERLLELGCGDGRVVLAAAKQGVNVVGYELNPFMALVAWLRTRRYRHHVKIIWGDIWRAEWPETEAIFTFLLGKFMPKLDKRIVQYPYRPVKLVSFAFQIPDKPISAEKQGVYLYLYK